MERIGIYGGTFNPPHIGHIQAAKYARQALKLDKILMIPSCQPPHKELTGGADNPDQRLEMLRLCLDGEERIQVCDLELARGGKSYTVDTVLQLRKLYPDAELVLCMGSDMFGIFHQWKDHITILENASLAVFCRGIKGEGEIISREKASLEQDGAKVYVVENPVVSISSTDLRRLLAFRCADPFLDPAVKEYICENGLYGTGEDYRSLPMDKLEQVVVSLLNPNRVRHVLGCRDTAAELARVWGADETDAARAGLLHDITKALDGPLQLTLCSQYGIMLDEFSHNNPKTLHALTGSLVAERIFGENEAVVKAIASHTTGKGNMNTLEKIIYVADYMEPNRDFPGVEELRSLAYTNLDKALKLGLEMTLSMLKIQGRQISPGSCEALAWLREMGI
ncbi:MAG: nicotinate (nicotinamide) nucleotide adenylyltransferase [Oscillospiraceae bacterium]|nr:nicotinate (nicotinamide) nucleotide adenylyltransferase [Oscillospiraceae bacterium]